MIENNDREREIENREPRVSNRETQMKIWGLLLLLLLLCENDVCEVNVETLREIRNLFFLRLTVRERERERE